MDILMAIIMGILGFAAQVIAAYLGCKLALSWQEKEKE